MRILDLTHDSHVAATSDRRTLVTLEPVGASNAPWRRRRRVNAVGAVHAYLRLLGARFGRYDWVIVPPIRLRHRYENPRWQRAVKSALTAIQRRPFAVRALRTMLIAGRCKYVVVDVADRPDLSDIGIALFRPRHYFKRNLIAGDGAEPANLAPLPMSIPGELFARADAAPPVAERPTDFFVAGDFKTAERERMRALAHALRDRGWRVEVLEERVPPEDFHARLARTKIVGAARGWGYHTWRMYEAAALGAVPAVTPPPAGMWSWFSDRDNCLVLPEDDERALAAIESLLRDPEALVRVAAAARREASRHNRDVAVADYVVGVLRGDGGKS